MNPLDDYPSIQLVMLGNAIDDLGKLTDRLKVSFAECCRAVDAANSERRSDRAALREAHRQIDEYKAQLDKERAERDQLSAEFHNSGRWSPMELREAQGCE